MFAKIIEYTLFSIRFTPNETMLGLIFWTLVNSGIRGFAVYAAIRLVMTAINHGSF